ncbi:thermonuclease family protein [Motiliproteus sediminis]|uniref:thermonuclease family protein n=1 Tax=Motiliproteus sediminis TaxID=1468178 RepID=UPI001FE2586B|nr:thermonuclease family protein [Motiliproteus sediminis]
MRYLKALLASAFLFCTPSPAATADCTPAANATPATLKRIIDGDTLLLSDGRRVRLIGIDTPELSRDNRPAEPLAHQARQAAANFLSDKRLLLMTGVQPHDRHGRTLAHIFDAEGNSLEAHLLRLGLGFQLSLPPNLDLRDCLRAAEAHARQTGMGVWSERYFAPREVSSLHPGDGGFGRYRGTVTRAGRNRSGPFIELDATLYLPVSREGLPYFTDWNVNALLGKAVEVRGWLSYRQLNASQKARQFRPFRLYLSHPDNLTPQSTNSVRTP